MKRIGIIALLLVTGSCAHTSQETKPAAPMASPLSVNPNTAQLPVEADPEPAIAEFEDCIHREGVILFRSWNGIVIGTDCDTDLRFMPNLHVEMVEYGIGVTTYKGTYQIGANGQISASFAGFGQSWPQMLVRRDRQSLVLLSKNGRADFVMGNRGGATLPGNAGSYWPFRHVTKNVKAGPSTRAGDAKSENEERSTKNEGCRTEI